MGAVDGVRAAQSPIQAMLVLAEALDTVIDKLDELQQANAIEEPDPWQTFGWGQTRTEGEHTDVIISPVDEATQAKRSVFATDVLRLADYYSTTGPDDERTWDECYALGGPVWLYEFDRECCMAQPVDIRKAMCEEVIASDPGYGHEMARDLLKEGADASRAMADVG